MKTAGIIIFVLGVLITLFTGLNYVSKEVLVESGDMSIIRDVKHGLSWSPLIGIVIIVLGVLIFAFGFRRQKQFKQVS